MTRRTATVFGSAGEFVVDAETGEVLTPREEMPDDYAGVLHVDLDEWRRYWDEPVPGQIDCLDLAWHCEDGEVVPAEDDHRREIDPRRAGLNMTPRPAGFA